MRVTIHVVYGIHRQALCCYPASGQGESMGIQNGSQCHGKIIFTRNDNPTYNRHYCVDILVLTIGYIPESGFGVTWWGPNDPISITIENRFKKNSGGCLGITVICPVENEDLRWDCARKDMMYPCDDCWRHNGVPAGRILVYAGRRKWCTQGAPWCWTNGLCQLEGALKSKSIGVQVFGMFIFFNHFLNCSAGFLMNLCAIVCGI